jgi:mitochondrial enoyl-[acyl-carrier protein] reductase / trans-2-enoyl-CoA reductase
LAPGSHLVTYGAMSKQPITLPSGLLIFRNLVFDGFWVSQWGDRHPELKEDTIRDILRLTRAGKFRDVPMQQIKWTWHTDGAELVEEVQGTLRGFRAGKSIFVFEGDG